VSDPVARCGSELERHAGDPRIPDCVTSVVSQALISHVARALAA